MSLDEVLNEVALLGVFAVALAAFIWALSGVSGHMVSDVSKFGENSLTPWVVALEVGVDFVSLFVNDTVGREECILSDLYVFPFSNHLKELDFDIRIIIEVWVIHSIFVVLNLLFWTLLRLMRIIVDTRTFIRYNSWLNLLVVKIDIPETINIFVFVAIFV